MEFLEQLGFQLAEDPEIALSRYLEYVYLDNMFLKTAEIQNKRVKLKSNKYKDELEALENSYALKVLCKEKLTIK